MRKFSKVLHLGRGGNTKEKFSHLCKCLVVPLFLVVTILACTFQSREKIDADRYTRTMSVSPVMPQAMAVAAYYSPIELQEEDMPSDTMTIQKSDGSDVTMLGDSITELTKPNILSRLPNAYVDGISNTFFKRNANNGLARLDALIANGKLRDILVFAFGTNKDFTTGSALEGYIDELVTKVGSNKQIILMTYHALDDNGDLSSYSETIHAAAKKYSNVSVADWDAALKSTGNPAGYIKHESGNKDVHPNKEGQELFADTIQKAVNKVTKMTVTTGTETAEWYVTLDEKTDGIGNACTLFNFVAYHWDDARQWLIDNYNENWPLGPVREDRPAIEVGPTVAMGMVANSIIECGWIPATYEKNGSIQTPDDLLALGDKYNHAWGMIQWDGGRRTNFARFCKASGFDVTSLEVMCYYLAYEYYASAEYNSYNKGLNSLFGDASPTLEKVGDAAYLFRKDVERGGGRQLARTICSNWTNRWNPSWGTKPSGGVFHLMNQYYTTGVVPLR